VLRLYYAPGTCALAPHIALAEAGARYEAARLDFARVVAIRTKALGPAHPDTLAAQAKLAVRSAWAGTRRGPDRLAPVMRRQLKKVRSDGFH
jgi:hypothetical protein